MQLRTVTTRDVVSFFVLACVITWVCDAPLALAWGAVDLLAERIRALGSFAPGSSRDFARLTSITEADGVPSAKDMLKQLVAWMLRSLLA
jgi:DNA-binding ferritin-like protein